MHGSLLAPNGRTWPLAARTDIGRAHSRLVRLDSVHASSRHAELRWTDGRWVLVDTGSRNGTRVNGQRLEPGVPRPLRARDRLVFGDVDSGEWVLTSSGPPTALAQRVTDGAVVVAVDETLLLPSPEEPEATVYVDPEGAWWAEHDGEASRVEDEQVVVLPEAWRLYLPPTSARTVPLPTGLALAAVTLHLEPDRLGEHVEAWIEHPDGRAVLGAGTHWPVALVLADQLLRDDGPKDERGWMDSRVIARQTGVRERSLDTYYTRIRQDLRAAGVEDAHRAVEARPNQRRLGVPNVRVHRG